MGVIVAVISLALIGALLANRFLRPLVFPDQEDKDGASVADLVAPVQLLAALFLAFVLAQSSQSYARARTAALNEAEVVDAAFETGDYLPEPQREAVQGALVCYTRAVIGPEWRTMQQGQQSPVLSIWTGSKFGVRKTLKELADAKSSYFSILLSADANRSRGRTERLAEANPTIPPAVVGLALLLIVLSIVVSGLRIPRVDNLPQIITMVIVAVLLTAALIAIYTLDRPFGGVTAIPPTAMERTQEDITEDFVELYGADRLPCDDQGNRKTEGASRASG